MSAYTNEQPLTITIPSAKAINAGLAKTSSELLNQAITGFVQFMLRYPTFKLETYALAFRELVMNLTHDVHLAERAMALFNQDNLPGHE